MMNSSAQRAKLLRPASGTKAPSRVPFSVFQQLEESAFRSKLTSRACKDHVSAHKEIISPAYSAEAVGPG